MAMFSKFFVPMPNTSATAYKRCLNCFSCQGLDDNSLAGLITLFAAKRLSGCCTWRFEQVTGMPQFANYF